MSNDARRDMYYWMRRAVFPTWLERRIDIWRASHSILCLVGLHGPIEIVGSHTLGCRTCQRWWPE